MKIQTVFAKYQVYALILIVTVISVLVLLQSVPALSFHQIVEVKNVVDSRKLADSERGSSARIYQSGLEEQQIADSDHGREHKVEEEAERKPSVLERVLEDAGKQNDELRETKNLKTWADYENINLLLETEDNSKTAKYEKIDYKANDDTDYDTESEDKESDASQPDGEDGEKEEDLASPFSSQLEQYLTNERKLQTVDLMAPVDKMEPPVFLPNYRNPCWYEAAETATYATNHWLGNKKKLSPAAYKFYFANAKERLSRRGWRLRCLPHFLILGMPKCGTTDLFFKLMLHQEAAFGGVQKEPHWWSRRRGPELNIPFSDYVDIFDMAAESIMRNVTFFPGRENLYHSKITGEGSASTLWDSRIYWSNNETAPSGPHTASLIQRITPGAKFIIILRNPTERLFSDYLYFQANEDAEDFHVRVETTVGRMNACFALHSHRYCAHKMKTDPDVTEGYCRNRSCNTHYVRLHLGLYSVFLSDWLSVFPRHQFLVLRLDEYSRHRLATLNSAAHFLGLDPYDEHIANQIVTSERRNANARKIEMLPQTRQLLNEFYRPFNMQLAKLMKDEKFKFES